MKSEILRWYDAGGPADTSRIVDIRCIHHYDSQKEKGNFVKIIGHFQASGSPNRKIKRKLMVNMQKRGHTELT